MSRKASTAPRRRPRQQRAAVTVDAILTAAEEVFARAGGRSSVNEIARRAGVSIGSLYQYYPSKDAIIVALIERHTAATLELLARALAEGPDDPLPVVVRRVVASMVEAHRSPLHAMLARQQDAFGHLDDVERAIEERASRAIGLALRARRDQITTPDPDFAAFLLVRAVDHLTHATLAAHPAALTALVDELTALTLGYLTLPRGATQGCL